MASPATELHAAMRAIIVNDAGIMAVAKGVYDEVPKGAEFPYISFGEISMVTDDADCIPSGDYTVQVDVWSRVVGSQECYDLTDLVYVALHESQPDLPTHALVEMRVFDYEIEDDPDKLTKHGFMSVTAMIDRR